MPNNETLIQQISEIVTSLNCLKTNKVCEYMLKLCTDCIKDVLEENISLTDKRKKVFEILLQKVRQYKEQNKDKLISKQESFTLLFLSEKLHQHEFNDVVKLRNQIIVELESLFD